MRLEIIFSNQFKRDLKLLAKRKLNLDLLEEVVEKLANQQPLEKKKGSCAHGKLCWVS